MRPSYLMSQYDIKRQLKLVEVEKRDIVMRKHGNVNRLIELELLEKLLLKDLIASLNEERKVG